MHFRTELGYVFWVSVEPKIDLVSMISHRAGLTCDYMANGWDVPYQLKPT